MTALDMLSRIPRMSLHLARHAGAALVARKPAQGLVEYGLILVLVMVVCVAAVTALGQTLNEVWYEKLMAGDSPFAP
jgi:hypothetical protein